MAESHVVSGLVAKRSELSGLLAQHQEVIRHLSASITNLDGTIKLFDPDYDLRTIKAKAPRPGNSWFEHGETGRLILDVFRVADGQLTTRQISELLLAKVSKQPDNQKDWDAVLKIVHAALNRMARSGSIPHQAPCRWMG